MGSLRNAPCSLKSVFRSSESCLSVSPIGQALVRSDGVISVLIVSTLPRWSFRPTGKDRRVSIANGCTLEDIAKTIESAKSWGRDENGLSSRLSTLFYTKRINYHWLRNEMPSYIVLWKIQVLDRTESLPIRNNGQIPGFTLIRGEI